jgi:hypothetical protein
MVRITEDSGFAHEEICEYFAAQFERPAREPGRAKVLQIDGMTRAELDAWVAGALT